MYGSSRNFPLVLLTMSAMVLPACVQKPAPPDIRIGLIAERATAGGDEAAELVEHTPGR